MNKDVVIKKSKINKKGAFAVRDFKKGEVVLRWKPWALTKSDLNTFQNSKKPYIYKDGKNNYFLMQLPERFVNHSCKPNAQVSNFNDIAIKNIKIGDEITSDYGKGGSVSFECNCGSKKCRKRIN